MKRILMILMLILTVSKDAQGYVKTEHVSIIHAQRIFVTNLRAQDPNDLKTQEKILAELAKLREENTSLQTQISILKANSETYKLILQNYEEQLGLLKSAIGKKSEIAEIVAKKEEISKLQTDALKLEVERLANENKKLRSSRNKQAFVAGLAGAILTFAALR